MALARLDGRCLLVWDNVEAVWKNRAVRQFVRGRLPDNCQSLLTTRKNPEQPMWHTVELRPLADAAMETLFMRLAVAAGVKIGGPADVEAIPKIIEHLEGHPLAMTLVVPLAQKRGIRRVWRELQQRPLKGIDAAFALSYERLTRLQRRLFARLSVFTIPFEWQAARALLPDEDAHQVDEALDVLVQRALVSFDGARYAYHALVRQVAYGKLEALEDDDPRPVHRLAAEYLEAKRTDEERGGTPEELLEEVDQWERAEAWEQFAESANRARQSLDRLGYWAEIQARLERALAAVEEHLEEPPLEATLLSDLGIIATKRAEWDRAIEMYERSLEIEKRVEDVHGMAQTFNNLGLVYADKGEWDQAIKIYEQSLETFERVSDVHGMAKAWANLGSVYADKGEWDRAIEMYECSLEIFDLVGDTLSMAQTWTCLGEVYLKKAEWERAIELYKQALEVLEDAGDVHRVGQVWTSLGLVYADKGEWDQAIRLYERSLMVKRRVGNLPGMATTWMNLGIVYYRKGDWNRAIEMYGHSLDIDKQWGNIHGMAQTWMGLGLVYAAKHQWDRAIEMYEQSLEAFENLGDVRGTAQTFNNLGLVYAGKGIWDRAIEMYKRSLEIYSRLEDIHGTAQTLGNLGLLYLQTERMQEAKPLFARAYSIFAQLGSPHAQTAANALVRACGSVDAANAYLTQLTQEQPDDM
jgi:tetratricopeptide (TPR) repeat protein